MLALARLLVSKAPDLRHLVGAQSVQLHQAAAGVGAVN
jgi:hypothetical protein